MPALTEPLIVAKTRINSLHLIQNLNLWGNNLDDVSLLKRMSAIEVLSLSVNNITSLEAFGQLPNLQELYLRKNKISDIREVAYLSVCKRLRVLWLLENPISQQPDYRLRVISAVPWLHKLDNVEVTQAELMTARDFTPPSPSYNDPSPKKRPSTAPNPNVYSPSLSSQNDANESIKSPIQTHYQHAQQQPQTSQRRSVSGTAFYPKTPAQQAMEAILSGNSNLNNNGRQIPASPMGSFNTPASTPMSPRGDFNGALEGNQLRSFSIHHPVSRNVDYVTTKTESSPMKETATDGRRPSSSNGVVRNVPETRQWNIEGRDSVNQRIRASSQSTKPNHYPINEASISVINPEDQHKQRHSEHDGNGHVLQAILTLSQGLEVRDLKYLQDRIARLLDQRDQNSQN